MRRTEGLEPTEVHPIRLFTSLSERRKVLQIPCKFASLSDLSIGSSSSKAGNLLRRNADNYLTPSAGVHHRDALTITHTDCRDHAQLLARAAGRPENRRMNHAVTIMSATTVASAKTTCLLLRKPITVVSIFYYPSVS